MKTIALTLLFALLILGCASRDITKEDKLHEESLIYTKKGEIVNSLETKAIIFATYLNKVDKKYSSDSNDSFLIGTYISNDFEKKSKRGLNNPFYTLTDSNLAKPISIKKLDKDDNLMRYIPIVNSWSDYFLVTFKANSEKQIVKLLFKSINYGKCELIFSKKE